MIQLKRILKEMDSIIHVPLSELFSMSIINDHLTDCRAGAIKISDWKNLTKDIAPSPNETRLIERRGYKPPFLEFHLSYLAQLIIRTTLGESCVSYFNANKGNKTKDAAKVMASFLYSVRVVPIAMVQTNEIRKEEFLRKWLFYLGVPVEGEKENQSESAMRKIDYAKTLTEAEEAEKKLQRELESRKKAMEELQRQATANSYGKGSYE